MSRLVFRRIKELERVQDIHTYHIEVQDKVEEKAFNATSPLRMTVVREDAAGTLFTICADQSGLIGLIRHLHRQGFVILSVSRER
jgi:hypothetical protein